MRLNINLASLKYEDVRRFYVRWRAAIGLTALLTLLLIGLAWINYSSTSQSKRRISEQEARIDALQKKREAAAITTNLPENHEVTAQKNYWNRQIKRRQLSWTQLFNDLQRIMPARAFVTTVHPEITQDDRLKLTLGIKGDTHENGLELVKKMEKSERFRAPAITAENVEKDSHTGAQMYKFDISTFYSPPMPTPGPGRAVAKEGF
jgi:Tfp pilus assembly protein PilN